MWGRRDAYAVEALRSLIDAIVVHRKRSVSPTLYPA